MYRYLLENVLVLVEQKRDNVVEVLCLGYLFGSLVVRECQGFEGNRVKRWTYFNIECTFYLDVGMSIEFRLQRCSHCSLSLHRKQIWELLVIHIFMV